MKRILNIVQAISHYLSPLVDLDSRQRLNSELKIALFYMLRFEQFID